MPDPDLSASPLAAALAVEARSSDGTGNNAADDSFGAIGQTFTRVAENSYSDGEGLMERARALLWEPLPTVIDPDLGRPVFPNNPDDEVNQGRAGANTADGRIPLTDDLRFVNQPTGDLPQARDISDAIFAQPKVDPGDPDSDDADLPTPFGTNDFHLFFGQALTHDMVETQVNVTAVSVAASTGIGWAGGVAVEGEPTAAFLVRVNPQSGLALRDAQGQVIPVFPPGTSHEDQVAALRTGTLDLPSLVVPGQAPGTTVTIPAVTAAQQVEVAEALANHQVLSLGAPFALQRTPGVEDAEGVRQQANTETSFLDLGNVYGKETTAFVNPAAIAQGTIDSGLVTLTGVTRASDGFVQIAIDTTEVLRRLDEDGGLSAYLLSSDDIGGSTRNGDTLLPTYGEVNAHQGLFVDVAGTTANEITASMGAIFDPTLEAFFSLDRFAAGDQRVNQNIATVTQQTIWARNHNEWAERVAAEHPDWTPDQVFDLARALNEAEYQKAIYDEYLPSLIGQVGMEMLGDYDGYDPNVNPAIINEWTTIAFRFGHDQSSNFVESLREDGDIAERVLLIDSFTRAGQGASTSVPDAAALDDWMRGQLSAAHQAIDGFVVEGNRGELFGVTVSPVTGQPVINDLTVFDVVRGRDHGVNDYIHLRAALGLETYAAHGTGVAAFEAWGADNGVSRARLDALIELYGGDFAKLDAYVGVLLERRLGDSQLGASATILIAMQFAATRDGDRFWYENRFADQPDILAMIEGSSMAEVIARTTGIDHVYRDAFLSHERIGGTEGRNVLNGTDGRDLIAALGGDDQIRGRDGNDDLFGGEGNDRLAGDAGDDRLAGEGGHDSGRGGAGRDTLDGGAGNDDLRGGEGDDLLAGGDGYDALRGEAGDDILAGGAGDDALHGGLGHDLLAGDAGDDTLGGNAGDDTLDGGEGRDALSGGLGNDVLIAAHDGGSYAGGGGIDTLWSAGGGLIDLAGRSLISADGRTTSELREIEDVRITDDHATAITGTRGNNVIEGGGGNDSLRSLDGLDTIWLSGGDDIVFDFDLANRPGETRFDTLRYEDGNGRIALSSEDDVFALFFDEGDAFEVGLVGSDSNAAVIRDVVVAGTGFSVTLRLETNELTFADSRAYAEANGLDPWLIA